MTHLARIGKVTLATLMVGGLFCVSAVRLIQADPSDDFSFTLAHTPEDEAYSLMPETQVTAILRDHLDLFPRSQAPRLARHLLHLCRYYRFDPAFVLALIEVESRFRTKVISPAGAVGLMQIMPSTARRVVKEMGVKLAPRKLRRQSFLLDPYINTTVGVAYLAWLRDHYRGMPPYYLVAAYNAGPAKIDELLARGAFRPVLTKKYYEAIRRGIPEFRFYRSPEPRPGRRSHRKPAIKTEPTQAPRVAPAHAPLKAA